MCLQRPAADSGAGQDEGAGFTWFYGNSGCSTVAGEELDRLVTVPCRTRVAPSPSRIKFSRIHSSGLKRGKFQNSNKKASDICLQATLSQPRPNETQGASQRMHRHRLQLCLRPQMLGGPTYRQEHSTATNLACTCMCTRVSTNGVCTLPDVWAKGLQDTQFHF